MRHEYKVQINTLNKELHAARNEITEMREQQGIDLEQIKNERDNAYKNIDRATNETKKVRNLLDEAENGQDGKQFEIDELRVNLETEVSERQKLYGEIKKLNQIVEKLTKRAEK